MARYHINDQGEPGVCRARTKPCRFGGETGQDHHFDSPEEARIAYEKELSNITAQEKLNKKTRQAEKFIEENNIRIDEILEKNNNTLITNDLAEKLALVIKSSKYINLLLEKEELGENAFKTIYGKWGRVNSVVKTIIEHENVPSVILADVYKNNPPNTNGINERVREIIKNRLAYKPLHETSFQHFKEILEVNPKLREQLKTEWHNDEIELNLERFNVFTSNSSVAKFDENTGEVKFEKIVNPDKFIEEVQDFEYNYGLPPETESLLKKAKESPSKNNIKKLSESLEKDFANQVKFWDYDNPEEKEAFASDAYSQMELHNYNYNNRYYTENGAVFFETRTEL